MGSFNSIKGLDKLGVVCSVEGNERTLAANAELKARRNVLKAKPVVVKQVVVLDAWERELSRLGFSVGGAV
jgi:hypothetical protein